MSFGKYLGTLFLISAAFVSQSCSDSSGNPQKWVYCGGDYPEPGPCKSTGSASENQAPKSIIGFLSLSITETANQMTARNMSVCSGNCSTAHVSTPVSADTLAFWEGEDFEIPDPKGDFGCRVTDITSFRSPSGNAIPGVTLVDWAGYAVPGTSMSQADLMGFMAANNIRLLNPDQEEIQLVPVTEAILNDAGGGPLLSFEAFETKSFSQPNARVRGPFYHGKHNNTGGVSVGSHRLHIKSNTFGIVDLPIDIEPFEVKNGDSKTALKLGDMDVRKDIQLEWPFEQGQKGIVVLSIRKNQSNRATGHLFCMFPNTGRATILAEEMDDYIKIPGKTAFITADGNTGKMVSIQGDSGDILFYVQIHQSRWLAK